MTLYSCECGNKRKLAIATIVLIDGKWKAKEALCEKCGLYMDSKPTDGMPNLKRTD